MPETAFFLYSPLLVHHSSLPSFMYCTTISAARCRQRRNQKRSSMQCTCRCRQTAGAPCLPTGCTICPTRCRTAKLMHDVAHAGGEASGGRNCAHRALPGQRFFDTHVCSHAGCSTSKSSASTARVWGMLARAGCRGGKAKGSGTEHGGH